MRRVKHFVFALVALCVLAPALPAAAGSVRWYDGDVTINPRMQYFGVQRTVHYIPYGIAVLKYDGPSMYWQTHDCYGNNLTYGASIPNSDPSGWVWIKPNESPPSTYPFCLAIQNTSGSGDDSFDAYMEWDGNF